MMMERNRCFATILLLTGIYVNMICASPMSELTIDEKRRDTSFLSLALTGEGVVDLLQVSEHLIGDVGFVYDPTGWVFNLTGNTETRPFSITGVGNWDNATAGSGSWTVSGMLGNQLLAGSGVLDLDSPIMFWSLYLSLDSLNDGWRTDLLGPTPDRPPGFLTITNTSIGTTGWQTHPLDPTAPSGIDGDFTISESAGGHFAFFGAAAYYHGHQPRPPTNVGIVLGGIYSVQGVGNSAAGSVTIPEPSTFSVFGLGIGATLGCAYWQRRSRLQHSDISAHSAP